MKEGPLVLLVEDEAVIALDLVRKLERAGCRVLGPAATGEAAEELARSGRPDLILMDNQLTGSIDGIEAASRIRAWSEVPIIFMTGFSLDPAFQERARAIAPAGFLDKPVSPDALLKAVCEACLR